MLVELVGRREIPTAAAGAVVGAAAEDGGAGVVVLVKGSVLGSPFIQGNSTRHPLP